MPSPKIDKFLQSVLAQVKFPFDKAAIRSELENHLLDRIQEYLDEGYDEETAARLAVEGMGDPKEIGTELNKQHNPFIGWLWKLTNGALIMLVIINIFLAGIPIALSLVAYNPAEDIPDTEIVYNLKIDEKVRLDDKVIQFTDVILEKNGDLNIAYKYYDTRFWRKGWIVGGIGTISDNFGNIYRSSSDYSTGGIITKGVRTVKKFDQAAEKLIISYDNYNRSYRMEIPLKAGEEFE